MSIKIKSGLSPKKDKSEVKREKVPVGIDFDIKIPGKLKKEVDLVEENLVTKIYTNEHYAEWNKNNDKNLFEEIIEKMMVESFMDETFKPYIGEIREIVGKKLPKSKKRFGILCTLDKNRNLLRKAKVFNNQPVSKMEHITDYIKILRQYVKVSEVEKKKFGEVMTPIDLVKEMLQKLPKEVWSNPNLKWLDPCNGVGPFGAMVVGGLMKGLVKWEPDDEKRYKHIIENMLYVCELQPKNMFLWMCMMDPKDEYDMNIYCGSFLDAGFDKHMKEVWGVEKFDVVVGNPPYQDSEKVSANSSLWTKFLIKIFDNLLIKDGHLCFITPSSWMGSTENQRSGIKSIFTENNLLILNINCAKYFNGVGSSFSYYIIKNNKDYGFTEIDNGEKFKVNIKDLPFFPKSMNLTAIKIIKKLETFVDKIDISSSLRNDKFDDNGEYKVWYGSNFKNSKIKGLNSDIKKVIVNLPGYLKPRYDDGLYATSKNNFWIPVKDSEEGKSLISYLNSSLIKYIIEKECKYSGFNNIGVMKFIPKIPFDREWSDEQLFEYFDISDEEKKLILQ